MWTAMEVHVWNSTVNSVHLFEEFLYLCASANLWPSKTDITLLLLKGVKIMNDLPEEHRQTTRKNNFIKPNMND